MRRLLGKIIIDTRPLRIRDYRRLWLSTAVTAVGSQLTAVAAPKQIFDLTGSSGYVGLTGAVGLVALIVFGLWGGAIADVFDRRVVAIVSGVGVAITSGLLWAQAATGLNSVWVVLALLGVQQAFVAVNVPARNAMIPRLVPAELVAPANALGFTVFMLGMVFGPLAAGALIPWLGLSTLYLMDTVALALAVVVLLPLPAMPPGNGQRPIQRAGRAGRMTLRRRPAVPLPGSARGPSASTPNRKPARGGAGLRDIAAGFRYLSTQSVLLASFLVDIIAMVAGMPRALFPEMAERTFGDPPGGGFALGWLYAAIPIGAAVCGLMSGWVSRLPRQGVVVTVAVIAWGAAVVGFGLSAALWLAVVFLAIGGAADLISAVHRSAILQAATTDEMRGRIQGVFSVVVAGGPRLADLVHGWAATAIGTAAATAFGGVLVVVLTALAVARLPAFWRYVPSAHAVEK